MMMTLVAGLALLAGCGKSYEVKGVDCALVPPGASHELTEMSQETLNDTMRRSVELRMVERQAREGEGPAVMVPQGSPVQIAEKQNSDIPDWTQVTIKGGEAKGKSGLIRRICLGESDG